jgi:hypothetical protein
MLDLAALELAGARQRGGRRALLAARRLLVCTTRIDDVACLAETVVIDGMRPEVNDLVHLPAPRGEDESVLRIPANMNVRAGSAARDEPCPFPVGRSGRSHSNVRAARSEEPG